MSEEDSSFFVSMQKLISDETSEFYVKQEVFESEQLKGFKESTNKYQGCYIANSIINMSNLKNMTVRNDDVFLVGYPKSG